MNDTVDPVIEAADLVSDGRILFLDARTAEAYARGHLPGAVRVPLDDWDTFAKSREASFEDAGHWNAAIAALGVDGTRPVVVYDDGKMNDAARVWFVLQHYGVSSLVLNGGLPALKGATEAASGNTDALRALPPSRTVDLFDRHRLRAGLGKVQVFDARTQAEYDGVDRRGNPRSGHLPGAVRIGHAELLDEHGRLRPAGALRELLTARGFKSGTPVVTYCQGGGRAALAALAAVRAGFTQVGVYYLSFGDWGRDEACPIDLPPS